MYPPPLGGAHYCRLAPRGVNLIDSASPRVGIVKLWVGKFLTFFMSVCNYYFTSHVFWGGGEFFFFGGGGYQNPYPMPALLSSFGLNIDSQYW